MFGFEQFNTLVKQIEIGKKLPDAIYTHKSAISTYPIALQQLINTIAINLKLDIEWNIVKLYRRDFKLTYLSYPDFDTYAYPALKTSVTVDLTKLTHRIADYSKSENPPILHRKECFVETSYPMIQEFLAITAEGEKAGLYEQARQIGFEQSWHKKIRAKGLQLSENGRLHALSLEAPVTSLTDINVERHLTAIDRNKLSGPLQTLAKNSFLDGSYTFLDYGCGKGDDARELEAHGLNVSSWDPVHNPEGNLTSSNIVNLGFVINVIEDTDERKETLNRAFELAETILVVSAMVAGESVTSQFMPYKDGVITSRNTFQKYYSQTELKEYIEQSLNDTAIAVGQGIFYVFKDKLKEQDYLLGRQKITREWHSLTFADKPPADKTAKLNKAFEDHKEIFIEFWKEVLDLGRIPANEEFHYSDDLKRVARSHKTAFNILIEKFGDEDYLLAKAKRREDLTVYFALGLFGQRQAYSKMPNSLKRDIKYFFTSYTEALAQAKQTLFSVGDPNLIEQTALSAYQNLPRGEFNDKHSWIIHKDWLIELPAILRIYVGCATQLYGDIDAFHLIKIHFTSGKVTLLKYDDWSNQKPLLVERLKIKLREQDIDFFEYGQLFTATPLISKDIYC